MALNLLGTHEEAEIKPSESSVEKHIPADEKKQEQKKAPAPEKKPAEAPAEAPPAVDLAAGVKRRHRMVIAGLSLLLILGAGAAAYGAYFFAKQQGYFNQPIQPAQPPAPIASNANTNAPAPAQPSPPPVPQPAPATNQPGVLPDTPLAPLRGAIIRFPNSSDLYLIENNGELRLVVADNVTFKNGQKISSLSPNLIYTLPIKWQSTRKGDKIVQGQVNFDPRVLTLTELLPFLQ